ncbi:MAG TPA: hypothetical protein VGE52_06520 [Pirellulales bacterium]
MISRRRWQATAFGLVAAILALTPARAFAQAYNNDLQSVYSPSAGGMAGVCLGTAQDATSALFGNPATLAQFTGTRITLGGVYTNDDVRLTHNGSVAGDDFWGAYSTNDLLIPNGAIAQYWELGGIGLSAGVGATKIARAGSNYQAVPGGLYQEANYDLWGLSTGLAVKFFNKISIGVAGQMGYGTIENGFVNLPGGDVSGDDHDYGVRGTFGLDWAFSEQRSFGLVYQMEMPMQFDNVALINGDAYSLRIEQPAMWGFGLEDRTFMSGNLLLAVDVLIKQWNASDFYRDVYDNQLITSFGTQYIFGNWKVRAGYSYATNPYDGSVGNSLGGAPVPSNVVEYLQATQLASAWRQRITVGVARDDLYIPRLEASGFAGWLLHDDDAFGGHTLVDQTGWYLGGGLTWRRN